MQNVIGVVGLGLLGGAICDRLLAAGYSVVGCDPNPVARQRLQDAGGASESNLAAVLSKTRHVFLSLPDSSIVRDVLFETALPPETVVFDTTTGDPDDMREFAESLGSQGVAYLETCVAGSSQQLRDGKATLLLAGDQNTIEQHSDLLGAIGETRFFLGAAGAAANFKLVHNLILGLNRAVLAEGLALGEKFGLDAQQMLDVLKHTPAASTVMTTKGKKIVQRNYEPQARLAQHLKDVQLIIKHAQQHAAVVPLSRLHAQLLENAVSDGLGDQDNSAIAEVFRN